MSTPAELPYRLGRAERRGAVLGWRAGQALAVALGASVLVLGLGAGGAGAVLGVLGCAAAGLVAAVPVRGRGLDEWVPVAVAHVVRPRRGALCAGAALVGADGEQPAHLRWPDGSATTVAALRARGLRALADHPRGTGEAVASWLRGLGVAGATPWTVTLLTVTGPGTSRCRDAPFVDVGTASVAHVAVTSPEPIDVGAVLAAANVDGAQTLGDVELAALLSDRVAPAMGTLLACDVVSRWRFVEAPHSVHAAFLVEEWPSGDVDEQVLAPLCVSPDRRTVALSIHVEELGHARQRTARIRTAAAADDAVTAGGGFLARAERSRDAVRDDDRADELAAGHGSVRVVGVVVLDAADLVELEAAAARLHADATSCGARLRRCDGDHRRGVLASVPGWCRP